MNGMMLHSHEKEELEEGEIAVAIAGDYAYWVADNTFYKAPVVDGKPDFSLEEVIDTDGLPQEELMDLFKILDVLK